MARQRWMQRLATWHIWLGWLAGVPILMWTATGLLMVAKPISEVRGDHLRKDVPEEVLPAGNPRPIDFQLDGSQRFSEMRTIRQDGRAIWLLTHEDGRIDRLPADTVDEPLAPVDESYVRRLVAARIVGGEKIASLARFEAEDAPFDLRRPIPSWQAKLADGTNVYVHAQTGEIAAVRTGWWRAFDFAWGLHIMDLQTREDTSHPILILFALLGIVGSLFGCILMFRRRRLRPVG